MKRIFWIAAVAVLVKLTGLVPFESSDVANLAPVEALTVTMAQNQVVLDGGDCRGYGADWDAALQDLRDGAEGKLFLGTAEQVILSKDALELLPDVVRCGELRPAAVICVCLGDPPDPADAASYLSSHDAGMTIQRIRAAMLAEEGVALPLLLNTEGGLRLYGTSDR